MMLHERSWAGLDDDEVLERFAAAGSGSSEGDRMVSLALSMITCPYMEWVKQSSTPDDVTLSGFPSDMSDPQSRRSFVADGYAPACSIILCRASTEPLVSYDELAERVTNPFITSKSYGRGWRARVASLPDFTALLIRFAHDRPGDAATLVTPFMHAYEVVLHRAESYECIGAVGGFVIAHTLAPMMAAIMDDSDIPMTDLVLTMALGAIPGQDCGYGGYEYNGPTASMDMLDSMIRMANLIVDSEYKFCRNDGMTAHLEPAMLMKRTGDCDERIESVLMLPPHLTGFHLWALPPLDAGFMQEKSFSGKGVVSSTDEGIEADWGRSRRMFMDSMLAWADERSLPMDSSSMEAASLVPYGDPSPIEPMRTMLTASCMDGGGGIDAIFRKAFPFSDYAAAVRRERYNSLFMVMYVGLCAKGSRKDKADRARLAADAITVLNRLSDMLADALGLKDSGNVLDIGMDDFISMLDELEAGHPLRFVIQNAAAHVTVSDGTGGDDETV